jgi:hypothetical protein
MNKKADESLGKYSRTKKGKKDLKLMSVSYRAVKHI